MEFLIGLIILIYSAILHELAHGFVAEKLGDPTPRISGRLTFNPIPHIDPVMSILVPLLLILGGSPVIFGGAKPVPVDLFNLKEGRKDLALVSLAGPLTNTIIAIIAAGAIHAVAFLPQTGIIVFLVSILQIIVSYNLMLAIFNLIPIPPLDGSKILSIILPERDAYRFLAMGQLGMLILIFLLFFPIGGFSFGQLLFTLYSFALKLLGL